MNYRLPQNTRVRWYEHSADSLVLNTGLGIVIDSEVNPCEEGDTFIYVLLCDNGEVRYYHENDIERYEEWEDEI